MPDRRTFFGWLAATTASARTAAARTLAPAPVVEAHPTALYLQPDGRKNLVRVTVSGLDAPAARARITDRHGTLAGTAGLLPVGEGLTLQGEVGLPLSEAADFQFEIEVGKRRVASKRLRLTPPRRWSLYWLASNHTDVGYTDLQERCLEVHRQNLDAALARLPQHPDFRWTAEVALQVISYVENRSPQSAEALLQAIRDGKIGFHALFANLLTGLLDHESAARMVWPAGRLAREHGLAYACAQITDVPGQALTFPMILAASGVRYLASGPNPDRAPPLLSLDEAKAAGLSGEFTPYPQLYWWEAPDGSRVLHWRNHHYGDGLRFGFDVGAEEMGRRLSDWLLANPVFQSPAYPYDLALLYGAQWDNASMDERLVANMEEFNRRFAFPRILPARAEDFFHEIERRYARQIPVRRGDTGLYWEDGAASTAAELATFRSAQLGARAAELLALWEDRFEPGDPDRLEARRRRAEGRAAMWRDLLLFGEHTWGAAQSISDPDGRQTVAQWAYKRRFIEGADAAARAEVSAALLRIGQGTEGGAGRIVFNASSWPRTDLARFPGAAGRAFSFNGQPLPAVDTPEGDTLVLVSDVPALGYLALKETERPLALPVDDGDALEASAGGFTIRLDPTTGAIASLMGPDGKERVKASPWAGLNQLIYVTGGDDSALGTSWDRRRLTNAPQLNLQLAARTSSHRIRLPGIGVRLEIQRTLPGFPSLRSTVTLYDALPWVDIENQLTKTPTLVKESLYVAFPFAFTKPTVEVEVPLGRMAVEQDQQPGSGRDWYCHTHWVWLHEGADGVVWSGPDAPLFTLNDIVRGEWRRRIQPDGTLLSWAMNNYWFTNYAARQGGDEPVRLRYRISLLGPGDPAEPVRRGWAACDPLYVSPPYVNAATGPLIGKDYALFLADKNVLVVGAKPADDGEGVVLKLLDVSGVARPVSIWPAGYSYQQARRTNLVEMNGDPLAPAADHRIAVSLPAWGVAAARLFTPREGAG